MNTRAILMSAFFMYVLAGIAKLILIFLPQTLANVISIYAFNKKKINDKNFWIATIISLAAIFWIRLLPVGFGIPSLLSMIVLIMLGVYFLKFPIRKTILGVFFVFIVTILLEIVTLKVATIIFGEGGFNQIMDNDLTYAFIGCPASILLLIISLLVYHLFTRHVKRSTDDGEVGETNS